MSRLLLVVVGLLLACTQPLAPSPGLPACAAACDVMTQAGCPEGLSPTCVKDCEAIARLGYIWTDDTSGPACVAAATTVEAIQSCNVKCQR